MKILREVIKYIKIAWELFSVNLLALTIFEIIYKFTAAFIFKPLLSGLIFLVFKGNGYSYLVNDNFAKYITSPTFWIVILVILFLVSIYTVFDICCIITCFHASYRRQKIPFTEIIRRGFISSLKILSPKNWRMILYLLLIIPMSQIFAVSGIYKGFSILDFIMQYIEGKNILMLFFIIASIYVELICVQWIFSFHHFTLNGETFKIASHHGRDMMNKKDFVAVVIAIISADVFLIGAYYGILYLGGAIIGVFSNIFSGLAAADALLSSAIAGLMDVVAGIFSIFSIPIVFLAISAMFYYLKEKKHLTGELPGKYSIKWDFYIEESPLFIRILNKKKRAIFYGFAILIAANIIYASVHQATKGELGETTIVAHRGESANYPENTMPAFEAAIEKGADEIELDVHMTKDGGIVVMHDENLKRTTGVDKEIYEMTTAQITSLDAGKYFSDEFEGVCVPTLDEVLELISDYDIRLNIELKPSEQTEGLAIAVIDMIYKYDVADKCYLSSTNLDSLRESKDYDHDIETIYITTLAYGKLSAIWGVDGVSIELSSVTDSIIKDLKKNNRLIYVWTLNSPRDLMKVMSLNVDGAITDDIEAAQGVLNEISARTFWENYLYMLRQIG